MNSLLDDASLRARLSEAGLERASTFTWTKSAEQTAAVYRSLLQ